MVIHTYSIFGVWTWVRPVRVWTTRNFKICSSEEEDQVRLFNAGFTSRLKATVLSSPTSSDIPENGKEEALNGGWMNETDVLSRTLIRGMVID